MNNLVSIIMPVFNAALYLHESLLSIGKQTYKNWQLVVVDDGSTDNSAEIYNSFAENNSGKCLYLKSSKMQSGASVCRNIGLENCSGDFVIFFDADDLLEPFCLEQRVNNLGENDLAIFKQHSLETDNNNLVKLFTGKVDNRIDATKSFVRMEAPWQTMAPLWCKSTLQKLQGFDESLVYMEDPDLHLRALLDDKIKVCFNYNLPPDNFYRINNMSEAKLEKFYDNSIKSRIVYLRKLLLNIEVMLKYKSEIKTGYFKFLKTFALSRIANYKEELEKLTNELFIAKVLSKFELVKLKIVFKIFSSNTNFVKATKLKGLAYKLI